jgi:hypothetical protein
MEFIYILNMVPLHYKYGTVRYYLYGIYIYSKYGHFYLQIWQCEIFPVWNSFIFQICSFFITRVVPVVKKLWVTFRIWQNLHLTYVYCQRCSLGRVFHKILGIGYIGYINTVFPQINLMGKTLTNCCWCQYFQWHIGAVDVNILPVSMLIFSTLGTGRLFYAQNKYFMCIAKLAFVLA